MNAIVLQFRFPSIHEPQAWQRAFSIEFQKHLNTLAQALPTSFVGNVLQSPNGHYWQITVDDAGVVTGTDLGTEPPKV